MTPVSHGKPCAGDPHARFDEGASASEKPRRNALLRKRNAVGLTSIACLVCLALPAVAEPRLTLKPEKLPRRGNAVVCKNVAYGPRQMGKGAAHPDVAQTCDLYLPAEIGKIPGNAPFFLYVHGGAWVGGNKGQPAQFFSEMAKDGFVVASMNYALCNPGRGGLHGFADMLRDIDAMVSNLPLIAEATGVKIPKFAIGGSSAGGHLSLLYAYDGANPSALGLGLKHAVPVACVFSDCGPSDISSPEFAVAGMDPNKGDFPTWTANFGVLSGLGRNYGDFSKLVGEVARYSPVNLVSASCPPTICLYGCTGAVPTSKTFTYAAGKNRPYSDIWKLMGSAAAAPKSVGTDGIVAVQNYESLTNRLAAAKVPHVARIEKAPHCQVFYRKPTTVPWFLENLRKYLR